jgi:hypothetical protein
MEHDQQAPWSTLGQSEAIPKPRDHGLCRFGLTFLGPPTQGAYVVGYGYARLRCFHGRPPLVAA